MSQFITQRISKCSNFSSFFLGIFVFFLQSLFERSTVFQVDDELLEEGYHGYRLRFQSQSDRDPRCLNRHIQLHAEAEAIQLSMESLVHHCEDDKYHLNKSDERLRGSGMIQYRSEDSLFGGG